MKKVIVLVLLSIIFFILDNVFMPFIAIRGVYPSILLVFCILYSIQNGKWEGMWLGIFCGLLQDVYFTNILGLNAITNMAICLIAGELGAKIFKEKKLLPVFCSFLLVFLKGTAIFLLLYYLGTFVDFSRVLFVSIYDTIISIIIYGWVYKLCQKEFMQIRWKF
jgi:rod shape-determining protein MreD